MTKQRVSYLVFGILDLLIALGYIWSRQTAVLGINLLYSLMVLPVYGIAHGAITYELTERVVSPNLVFYLLFLPAYGYVYLTLTRLTGMELLLTLFLLPLYPLFYILPSVVTSLIFRAISKGQKR